MRFRGTLIGQASSASDIIAQAITLDPTGYTEFADFSALFSEVRVVSTKITFVPYAPYSIIDGVSPINQVTGSAVCGLNLGNTSTAPSSRPTVFSIPGSKPVMLCESKPITFVGKVPNMSWALMSAPVATAGAGCYGAWDLYGSGFNADMSNSVQLEYYVENIYECRGRR
jgi:hypothetical protein